MEIPFFFHNSLSIPQLCRHKLKKANIFSEPAKDAAPAVKSWPSSSRNFGSRCLAKGFYQFNSDFVSKISCKYVLLEWVTSDPKYIVADMIEGWLLDGHVREDASPTAERHPPLCLALKIMRWLDPDLTSVQRTCVYYVLNEPWLPRGFLPRAFWGRRIVFPLVVLKWSSVPSEKLKGEQESWMEGHCQCWFGYTAHTHTQLHSFPLNSKKNEWGWKVGESSHFQPVRHDTLVCLKWSADVS